MRLYVTVRVTTCRTLTALAVVALLGASKYRIFQSDGENGEYMAVALRGVALSGVAVRGESLIDTVLIDWGMRSRRSAGGDLGDLTLQGERGGMEIAGDFNDCAAETTGLVAVEG